MEVGWQQVQTVGPPAEKAGWPNVRDFVGNAVHLGGAECQVFA